MRRIIYRIKHLKETGVVRGQGREWGNSRANHSEWIPVRQKWNQGGGSRIGTSQIRRKGEWPEKVEEGNIVKTFLFRNFPPSLHENELFVTFQEAGRVVDLFCPKKVDVLGRRFGFVRIKVGSEEEGETMLEKLNSLWIVSYKIRAYIPQFERKKAKTAPPKTIKPNFTEEGRSFAMAVAGK